MSLLLQRQMIQLRAERFAVAIRLGGRGVIALARNRSIRHLSRGNLVVAAFAFPNDSCWIWRSGLFQRIGVILLDYRRRRRFCVASRTMFQGWQVWELLLIEDIIAALGLARVRVLFLLLAFVGLLI